MERAWNVFTWYDGESGAEIVRISKKCASACAHPGPCDDDVAAWVDRAEWLASAGTIRRTLRRYGAWDEDELADDDQNRHRALWLAAADISERPEDYH